MQPILHLSIPVRDLDEATDFYVHRLGCRAARTRHDFVDVWFYGMQVTLHERPDEAPGLEPGGCRHFGVTLERGEFDETVDRLEAGGVASWSRSARTSRGRPQRADEVQGGRPERQRRLSSRRTATSRPPWRSHGFRTPRS